MLICFDLHLQVKEIEDEEWSYIPVGGPLPIGRQPITAFGAAASLIHPATGYSLARSLREAPGLAKEVSQILQQDLPIEETAQNVWKALWPPRKRRQVGNRPVRLCAARLPPPPPSPPGRCHHERLPAASWPIVFRGKFYEGEDFGSRDLCKTSLELHHSLHHGVHPCNLRKAIIWPICYFCRLHFMRLAIELLA